MPVARDPGEVLLRDVFEGDMRGLRDDVLPPQGSQVHSPERHLHKDQTEAKQRAEPPVEQDRRIPPAVLINKIKTAKVINRAHAYQALHIRVLHPAGIKVRVVNRNKKRVAQIAHRQEQQRDLILRVVQEWDM